MSKSVNIKGVRLGGKNPLALIAGPCVIEGRKPCLDLARRLAALAKKEKIPLIFKASYDKANRTSHRSFRGPGLLQGLEILKAVKDGCNLPILTDVHTVEEIAAVADVVDVIQIPAFLCRQTDVVMAAGDSGRVVNIKKGQFLSPWDMEHVVAKVEKTGNKKILLTERGVSFGYNNLVADMRSLMVMQDLGYPVVFDATHSVQRPGGAGGRSGGDGDLAPGLARAAVAVGCDAVFIETHVTPDKAKSDRDNAMPVSGLASLWRRLVRIDEAVS